MDSKEREKALQRPAFQNDPEIRRLLKLSENERKKELAKLLKSDKQKMHRMRLSGKRIVCYEVSYDPNKLDNI